LKSEFKLTSSFVFVLGEDIRLYISGENHKHHIRFIVGDVWWQDVDIVAVVDIAAAAVVAVAVDDIVDRMIAAVAVAMLS